MAKSRIRYPGSQKDYGEKCTHYRIYREYIDVDEVWHVDAIDDEGGFSNWLFSYPTFDEAIECLPHIRLHYPL